MQDPSITRKPLSAARQRCHRFSVGEAVAVAKEYRAGANMYELAAKFGVHRTTISECLRKLGVPLRRQGLQPEDVPEAAKLYKSGWSLARLGAKYDCHNETIRQNLLKHGVVMRPRRGGRKRAA